MLDFWCELKMANKAKMVREHIPQSKNICLWPGFYAATLCIIFCLLQLQFKILTRLLIFIGIPALWIKCKMLYTPIHSL